MALKPHLGHNLLYALEIEDADTFFTRRILSFSPTHTRYALRREPVSPRQVVPLGEPQIIPHKLDQHVALNDLLFYLSDYAPQEANAFCIGSPVALHECPPTFEFGDPTFHHYTAVQYYRVKQTRKN